MGFFYADDKFVLVILCTQFLERSLKMLRTINNFFSTSMKQVTWSRIIN